MKKILVVDDSSVARSKIEKELSRAGYEIIQAASGLEALGILASEQIVLVTLDVNMPELDGYETCLKIRNHPNQALRSMPIIFVTASDDIEGRIKGFNSGGTDFVSKSFARGELANLVRQILEPEQHYADLSVMVAVEDGLLKHTLSDSCRRIGAPTVVVNTVNDLYEYIKSYNESVDLILVEYEFSKQSAPQICQTLRKDLGQLNIPIVVLVKGGSDIDPLQLFKSGVTDYVVTPFVQEELTARLKVHCDKSLLLKRNSSYISELEETQRNLEVAVECSTELYKKAEEVNAAKSAFFSNITHELRTPLTAILGFAEAGLEDQVTVKELQDSLITISRNGRHLLTLINDILDSSKIEAGHLELERISFCPFELLADVEDVFKQPAAQKELNFTIDFNYPMPNRLNSDPTRIKQSLINLIGNAIKFTEQGFVKVKVTYDPTKDLLVVAVEDSGIGIDREGVEKLFQPFTQVDVDITRKFGGTGLGLSISKRLARMLGGDIVVESQAGIGSTFTLSVKVGSEKGIGLLMGPPDKQLKRTKKHKLPSISGQILLVDDSKDNQKLVTHILSKAGADVVVACNGEEGVKLALENDFRLVFMDTQMPVMDGHQATSLLREKGYKVPIIALTANTQPHQIQQCMDAGADAFLAKPFKRERMFELLTSYLG